MGRWASRWVGGSVARCVCVSVRVCLCMKVSLCVCLSLTVPECACVSALYPPLQMCPHARSHASESSTLLSFFPSIRPSRGHPDGLDVQHRVRAPSEHSCRLDPFNQASTDQIVVLFFPLVLSLILFLDKRLTHGFETLRPHDGKQAHHVLVPLLAVQEHAEVSIHRTELLPPTPRWPFGSPVSRGVLCQRFLLWEGCLSVPLCALCRELCVARTGLWSNSLAKRSVTTLAEGPLWRGRVATKRSAGGQSQRHRKIRLWLLARSGEDWGGSPHAERDFCGCWPGLVQNRGRSPTRRERCVAGQMFRRPQTTESLPPHLMN